jgi:hypothetical protein
MVIDRDGIIRYRGAGVDTSAIRGWIDQLLATSVGDDNKNRTKFELFQNYPNPFNPDTRIIFDLPETGQVVLQIFDIEGRLVTQLLDTKMRSGRHELSWNGLDTAGNPVSSGIYIYRLRSGKMIRTKKMTLLR